MNFSSLAFEVQWEQCFALVEKWKSTMIEHILSICEDKLSQIQFHKDQAEKSRSHENHSFVLNFDEYFQHESILSSEIDRFKTKLSEFKQNLLNQPMPLNIEIDFPSLENSIRVQRLFSNDIFHQRQIHKRYQIPNQIIRFLTISSNQQILLINKQSNIYLYDKSFRLISQWIFNDYTHEYLRDLCWFEDKKIFVILCDYSFWSLTNQDSSQNEFELKKLAEIRTEKHMLTHFVCFHQLIFFVYNYGEFIDRWILNVNWTFEKRWTKSPIIQAIAANDDYLLFSTNQSIDLCTENLIRQYSIDLIGEHIYTDFIYLSSYHVWLFIDKQTNELKYFHRHQRILHSIDELIVQKLSLINNNLVLIFRDKNQIEIVSI